MRKQIRLLAPARAMPAEGADLESVFDEGDEVEISDLLDAYASLFRESPVAFRISPTGAVTVTDPSVVEDFVSLSVGGEAGKEAVFSLDGDGGEVGLDLTSPALEVTGAEDTDGVLRDLVGQLSTRFRSGISANGGRPVPLVRWHAEGDGEGGVAQVLGVWLADESELEAFGGKGDGARLIFDSGDVEGHGVRQALASLSVLGVMLGSVPTSDAGFLFFKSKAEREVEQRARVEAAAHPGQARAVVDRNVISKAKAGNVRVIVDISKQRAYLVTADGEILINTPVSTARSGKYTPRGEFKITQRVRTGKRSTIYGCALPYWMRLDDSAIGLHVGDLPGHPASAGCVRLPAHVAPILFDATRSGTTVKVVSSWQGSSGLVASR